MRKGGKIMENMDLAHAIVQAAKFLGAGIAMGFGAIGPAIGEGHIGAYAMDAIARQPEMSGSIVTRMLLAMAVTESTGLYSLLIAFILLFIV